MKIWNEKVTGRNAVDKWCIKINRVKKFLKGWGLSLKGHTKKYKKCLTEELSVLEKMEEANPLPAHLVKRKTFILSEKNRLLEEEESYWHKRSNNKWLLEGDLNTEFFHRVANGKKRKNTIFSIQKDGRELEKNRGNTRAGDRLLQRPFFVIQPMWILSLVRTVGMIVKECF